MIDYDNIKYAYLEYLDYPSGLSSTSFNDDKLATERHLFPSTRIYLC